MKKIILGIAIVIFLLLALGATVIFIRQRTAFFGRATSPTTGGEIAPDNCYLFASPLQAQANGSEKIRVTAFILDSQGKGVTGEAVFLGQNERLEITPVQTITDNLGRAIFDISSKTPAEYLVEARVGSQVLPQRVKVSFR